MDKTQRKIAEIAAVADELPGVIIILNADLHVAYMSNRGLAALGTSMEELKSLGADYHQRFFNPEDINEYIPKIWDLLHNTEQPDAIVSFFQQVRSGPNQNWEWHFSAMRVLMRDDTGKPLLIMTMAYPVDPAMHVNSKISRIMEENVFYRKHSPLFASLGNREKEVLRLLALGKSAVTIAEELFIAETTVETHRKNIKRKLNINTTYELTQFAQAFNLI
ncbi:regulatory LuxR family protein [Chitinophaga skermanii]|uniref:Regulatory LuxR family protein n=1 Tax=Chitinophaga skermanii TaxID=331697 RepID=A0A327Q865_9BACT|nr:helix-turn-helix transcriptional regulator [Chitinophaga skermanii]RAJ00491.1 regulatory LuxR family protein [Chitinophaga skermanii]